MGGQHIAWRLTAMELAWPIGAFTQMHARGLQPVSVCAIACVIGLLGVVVGWRWRRAFLLAIVGTALVAAASTDWRASTRLSQALPSALEGQDLDVTGVVASLPQVGATGVTFLFQIDSARSSRDTVQVPERLSLAWYAGFGETLLPGAPQNDLRAGQRWRFTVRLRQPHGNQNPHGFDYELHLFEQGVRATGSVRDGAATPPVLLARDVGHRVDRLRQRMRDAIQARVHDPRAAGVLAALAVGDQGAIDRDDWQLFRVTGVAHLMSISGLHVTMFAWLAGLLISTLWRRSARAPLWLPAPVAARIGGLVLAVAYAVFSGWGVPAQRTVWMLAAVAILQGGGRRWPWPMVLLSAAFVVSAVDPWALLQPGFWLSFAAVGLLMASEPVRRGHLDAVAAAGWRGMAKRLPSLAAGGLRTQVIATLGLAPLTLVFFQQLSVVGFVANLVAIPLVTLVITPLALLGGVVPPLWGVGAWVVDQTAHGLTLLAAWPGAVWTVPAAPVWAQVAGLCGAALGLMPLPWRLRALAVPLVLPLLWPQVARPAQGQFELLAVDVGQGTAVLVRTKSHLLVYDTGPQYSRESNAGDRVLLPLLRARGEHRIDRMVLSHRDSDHVGGAAPLLAALPVDELLSSLETGHPLLGRAAADRRCNAGQSWTWDGVQFDVLHPEPGDHDRPIKPNAKSCVVRVHAVQGSVLLTGDIERDQEARLVAHDLALKSDVLLVPHHGSRTSSTAAFLDAVEPSVAVIQAGYRNRFGHPVAEVLARLDERGVAVVDSPSCGAWHWPAGQGAREGRCWRAESQRYWRWRADDAGSPAEPGP
jgi:competence protein ComEC